MISFGCDIRTNTRIYFPASCSVLSLYRKCPGGCRSRVRSVDAVSWKYHDKYCWKRDPACTKRLEAAHQQGDFTVQLMANSRNTKSI